LETDFWKEEIERIDKQILEDLRYAIDQQKERALRIMRDYNIPHPSQELTDIEFIKYVDDYVGANFVLH
jgi:hypothetical protein